MPDQDRPKHGPYTTWQWSVIGAYLVAIILSVAVGMLANRAVTNTEILSQEICFQINYLDRVSKQTANPQAGKNIHRLVLRLRSLNTECPSLAVRKEVTH
jgi:hypothetical protein